MVNSRKSWRNMRKQSGPSLHDLETPALRKDTEKMDQNIPPRFPVPRRNRAAVEDTTVKYAHGQR